MGSEEDKKSIPVGMMLANFVMALFFAYAAYVQQNDPDALLWICIYSSAGLLSLIPETKFTNLTVIVMASGFLLYNFLSNGRIDFNPETELGRESGGLSLIVFWFFVRLALSRNQRFLSLVIAFAIASTAFIVPLFLLKPEHTVDHCRGLGIPAGGISSPFEEK